MKRIAFLLVVFLISFGLLSLSALIVDYVDPTIKLIPRPMMPRADEDSGEMVKP